MRRLAQIFKYGIAILNDRFGQLQARLNIGTGMLNASLRNFDVHGTLHHAILELGSDVKGLIGHGTSLLRHDVFCEIEVSKSVHHVFRLLQVVRALLVR